MINKINGIGSFVLIQIGAFIGLYVMALSSMVMAVIYGGILVGALGLILYSFCAKCPCKEKGCGHYFPGKLTKFFPDRRPGPYTSWEYGVTFCGVLLIIATPQYWLFQYPVAAGLFWLLIVIALVQINLTVCKSCENGYCAMNKNQRVSP